MDEPKKHPGSAARGVGMAVAMAAQLVLAILIGFLLGHWLDGLLHTAPWLSLAGGVVGIVAGFLGLFRLSKVVSK